MMLLSLAWGSLRRHRGSSAVAAAALAVGVGLLLAVAALRTQVQDRFTRASHGVDAVLGPRGSPLQVVLNAVHHLEAMPGRIPLTAVASARAHPAVADAFPFVTGHTHQGVRVNGVDPRFWTAFPGPDGPRFACAAGRLPEARHEAVAGAEAAARLGLEPGHRFTLRCGLSESDPAHQQDTITVTGVLTATGTPHDRVIFLRLEDVYDLGGHDPTIAAMATDAATREVSGAYLVLRHIRGGGWHPGVQDVLHRFRDDPRAQVVLPAEVLPRLFAAIGWADRVLGAVAALVALLGAAFLALALVGTLRERRRDLALLRALGAGRGLIGGLVLLQALGIAVVGTVLGLGVAHGLLAVTAPLLTSETGLPFTAWCWTWAHGAVLVGAPLLGVLAGLIPAAEAYRLPLLDTLHDR